MKDPKRTALRLRLLARIHRRFRTVTDPLDLGGGRVVHFTRVADPNRVLDEVAAAADLADRLSGRRASGDALHLPYWAELWDSALAVARLVLDRSIPLLYAPAVLNVLDLGCGMGLTGTAAAMSGHRVTLADLEAPALLFARHNALQFSPTVRTRRLNWQTARLDERFDLILGADILYERSQWQHLHPFWLHHLSPGGSVLLGEPGRPAGNDFTDFARAHDWLVTRHDTPVPTRTQPIRVFELHRR